MGDGGGGGEDLVGTVNVDHGCMGSYSGQTI
eukprot:COSAG06_NODE_9580_length_1865_cov_4.440544_1_plen_30_part_10